MNVSPFIRGVLVCLLSLTITVLFVNFLNFKAKRKKRHVSSIQAVEIKRRKPKNPQISKVRKRRKVKKVNSKKSTAPPPPFLNTNISGVKVDIPKLNLGDSIGNIEKYLKQGDDEGLIMTPEAVDSPPKPIETVMPEYPRKQRLLGVEGYVTFNLLIDEGGNIKNIALLDSKPPGVFDEIARDAVLKWHFKPAYYKGRPVKVWATQKIVFSLD